MCVPNDVIHRMTIEITADLHNAGIPRMWIQIIADLPRIRIQITVGLSNAVTPRIGIQITTDPPRIRIHITADLRML